MQLLPLEIRVHGTSLAGDEARMIRRCVGRFASSSGHVVRCRVTVDTPRQPSGAHTKYTARVQLFLPSDEIVVAEPPSDDRFGVIQEALDAAGRQLEDYVVHHWYHPA